MKVKKILLLASITLITLISCDTNDNNDPNVPCDATFVNFVTNGDGSTNGTFNAFEYQKTTGFNVPNQLLASYQNYLTPNLGIRYPKSTIDVNTKVIEYRIADSRISLDLNTNTITQSIFTDGDNPEFLNGTLLYLKTDNIVMPTTFQIIDENLNNISPVFNVNLSNSGLLNTSTILSTSNKVDKIFYLSNTTLLTYNSNSNTLSNVPIDSFSSSNTVYYFGLEYVDANTLYTLRGNVNNLTLELVKIDITNPSSPIVSTLINHTTFQNNLSFNPYSAVNGNAYVQSDYDSCDNSYYFTYTEPTSSSQPYIVEVKLNSNTINEFPGLQGYYYYSLKHY